MDYCVWQAPTHLTLDNTVQTHTGCSQSSLDLNSLINEELYWSEASLTSPCFADLTPLNNQFENSFDTLTDFNWNQINNEFNSAHSSSFGEASLELTSLVDTQSSLGNCQDNSLIEMLNEIESISSILIEDTLSPTHLSEVNSVLHSPIYHNEITCPDFNENLNRNTTSLDYESSTSSSSSGHINELKKVKSGRVNKRESNKEAANKYRAKKTKERDQLFAECESYAKKNDEMKQKIGDIETEISLIKNLLVQAFLAKNKAP